MVMMYEQDCFTIPRRPERVMTIDRRRRPDVGCGISKSGERAEFANHISKQRDLRRRTLRKRMQCESGQ